MGRNHNWPNNQTTASKKQSIFYRYAPYGLLAIFALLCFMSQREKSITVDEFSHFPSGLYNVLTLDWRMDRKSPPLVKCLPAISCLLTRPEIEIRSHHRRFSTWAFGYYFMFNNFEKYRLIFEMGRCVTIVLGVLAGFILYKFAREIYGPKSALFVLFLYVFNPNIIANSRLTTIDVGATCMIFLSIYCFWRFLKNPSGGSAVVAGITLGVAQVSKFTALLLYPTYFLILSLLVVLRSWRPASAQKPSISGSVSRYAVFLLLMILVSLLLINMGYLFNKTLLPLGDFTFQSSLMQELSSYLGDHFPVPLPMDYLEGFDGQLALSEGDDTFYTGYLMGEHSQGGWWYYYFIALFVKNPLAFSILMAITLLAWILGGGSKTALHTSLCIWVPLAAYYIYFSFFTNIPIGIRFLLPTFPLLFIAAGHIFNGSWIRRVLLRLIMQIVIIAYLIPTVVIYPDYLSFFNLAAGGPSSGHKWLIDSNLDWGQDLPGLKNYMTDRGIEKICLGYFGRVDPKLYGIDYELAGRDSNEGITVISVNFLVGRPYYLLDPDTKSAKYVGSDYYKHYKEKYPVEIIGHTLYVFEEND